MALVQVRDVPEDVHMTLKHRAAERGQSLNTYVRDLLQREASRPTVAEVLERAARRGGRPGPSAAELVREARDERAAQLDGLV